MWLTQLFSSASLCLPSLPQIDSVEAFLLKTKFFVSPDLKIYLIKITQKLGVISSFSRVCLMNRFLKPECLCISNICHQLIFKLSYLLSCLFLPLLHHKVRI